MTLRPALIAAALAFAMPAQAEEVLFKCTFDWRCDPNRKCDDAWLDLRYKVDVETSAVTRLAGDPLTEASLILGDRALTILEAPVSGGTATTTVMLTDGEAVHTDHAIEGVTLSPMIYLGECITF